MEYASASQFHKARLTFCAPPRLDSHMQAHAIIKTAPGAWLCATPGSSLSAW
jgi:hypothetical protein